MNLEREITECLQIRFVCITVGSLAICDVIGEREEYVNHLIPNTNEPVRNELVFCYFSYAAKIDVYIGNL